VLDFVFHHVGVVTSDMEASITFYQELGYVSSQKYKDDYQQAIIVLLDKPNDPPTVELIQPMNINSPAAGWIKRINVGAYHTCYEVSNIDKTIDLLKNKKIARVSPICPAVAFNMRNVAFLWGRQCGLIEILEKKIMDKI